MIINPAIPEPGYTQENQLGVTLGQPATPDPVAEDFTFDGLSSRFEALMGREDPGFHGISDKFRNRYEALMGGGSNE